MAVLWNIFILVFVSARVCLGSMCYYTTSYYDLFEKSQVYKKTHKYCPQDCCTSSTQVTCCKKTDNEDDTDNDNSSSEPRGLMTFGAVFGSLIGIAFGLSVCVLVGCYIKKVCFRPIEKLEPKRGKPEHHRAAKYLATLNKGKDKAKQNQKAPPRTRRLRSTHQPPPRTRRLRSTHQAVEATNFAFEEDVYDEVLDHGANPTTDYFFDDVSNGPSPSPILYNNFEKGGMRIVVSPSCIDFHNLDDDDEVMVDRTEPVNFVPKRSVSVDCGQVDHTVNRTDAVVGLKVDGGMRHASIC